jgi:hypothetical protein
MILSGSILLTAFVYHVTTLQRISEMTSTSKIALYLYIVLLSVLVVSNVSIDFKLYQVAVCQVFVFYKVFVYQHRNRLSLKLNNCRLG